MTQASPIPIVNSYPPNYRLITEYLTPDRNTVFCYGSVIYNPFKIDIPLDVIYHEGIHILQQREFASPDYWWNYYLMDRDFRLKAEIEAYTKQWLFVKTHVPKATKESLEDLARSLSSSVYNFKITEHEAKTLIRHYAKTASLH